MHRYVANPKKIFTDRVEGRAAIYLDTNAWSDLAEAATDDARVAREIALALRSRGMVIFPLAFSAITELLMREINADSIAQADLMDSLSDGVAFRGIAHLRDVEVLAACEFMLTGRGGNPVGSVFTITPCYLADSRVVFPEGWSEVAADDFMRKLEERGFPGMRWLQLHMREPQYLKANAATDDKYVREITRKRAEAKNWAADASGKLNAKKLRVEEHLFVLNRYILENVLRVLDPSDVARIAPHLQRLQTDTNALKGVVEAMPSTWLSCEINVQRMLEPRRRTRTQDFYDHEHAVLAVPYTQIFVTSDGGILDLVRKTRATDKFGCRVVRGMQGLRAQLSQILAA